MADLDDRVRQVFKMCQNVVLLDELDKIRANKIYVTMRYGYLFYDERIKSTNFFGRHSTM